MDDTECEQVVLGPPKLVKLAELIYGVLLSKYSIEDIMAMVKKYKDKTLFVVASRGSPRKVSLIVDNEGRYCYSSNSLLFIPVPKKFAVLEPDKHYFEQTLRANILLAVLGADERDLHR